MERTNRGLDTCPTEMWSCLRGAVHDVRDVERRDFRAGTHLWASGNEPWAWAICVSSAKRIGAQREGELGCDGKKFGRKAKRMDEGGFGGEACRSNCRRVKRARRGGLIDTRRTSRGRRWLIPRATARAVHTLQYHG